MNGDHTLPFSAAINHILVFQNVAGTLIFLAQTGEANITKNKNTNSSCPTLSLNIGDANRDTPHIQENTKKPGTPKLYIL